METETQRTQQMPSQARPRQGGSNVLLVLLAVIALTIVATALYLYLGKGGLPSLSGVQNQTSNNVTIAVLSGTQVIASVSLGAFVFSPHTSHRFTAPLSVFTLYDPANGYIYALNDYEGTASVISGISKKATIQTGVYPTYAVYDPANGYVYVANAGSNSVSVLNGTSIMATIGVGAYPVAMCYNPSNGYVYVANYNSSSVSVLNGKALAATVHLAAANPTFILCVGKTSHVYTVNGDSTISVINGTSASILSTHGIPYLLFNDSFGNVYVSMRTPSRILFINGTSQAVQNVSTESNPFFAVYNPSDNYLYTIEGPLFGSNSTQNFVSVINGTKLLLSTSVPGSLSFGAYNPGNGYVYMATDIGSQSNVVVFNGTSKAYSVPIGYGNVAFLLPNPLNSQVYAFMFSAQNNVTGAGAAELITGAQAVPISISGWNAYRDSVYDPSNRYVYAAYYKTD